MYTITRNTKILCYVLIFIGIASFSYGFFTDAHRAWPALLMNNFFFLGISLAAALFVSIQHLAESGWPTLLQRIPESIAQYLPFSGLVMLIIIGASCLHLNHIYHWMDSSLIYEYVYENTIDTDHPNYTNENKEGVIPNKKYDYIIAGKTAYLNIPFFMGRAIAYVLIWTICIWYLRRISLREDLEGGLTSYKKTVVVSAVFIIFFGISSSMAAWDWLMSIDTHWFSTMFGWYIFSGMFITAITTITLLLIHLKKRGYLEQVNQSHFHDLGKYMFAFSVFWTYLWFSQYMLIWYSHIPEEIAYFMARFDNYHTLFWSMVVINFVFPVLILMSSDAKKNLTVLTIAGIIIIIGHWLDIFLIVMPGTVFENWHLGLVEIGGFLGFLGAFILIVLKALSRVPLIPKNHPLLKESELHHT